MVRKRWLVLACAVASLTIAAPAEAVVTIGPNPLLQRSGIAGEGGAKIFMNAVVPDVTLASPIDGVVVRWRARRGKGPGALTADTITLRILRGTGVMNEFTAVGTSESHDVPGGEDPVDVYEYPTRLPIAAGDLIGLGTKNGTFPYRSAVGASYLTRINPLLDGETATLDPGAFSDRHVLVNADVEADCDGDGFGDETQDPMVAEVPSCGFGPRADTTAPRTRIDRGPKKRIRTRRRRVKVRFRFSADEPGSSFECRLDGRPFKPCASPKRYRVRATARFKKHTFRVRAADAAGNVDATPAKRSFKVRRLSAGA